MTDTCSPPFALNKTQMAQSIIFRNSPSSKQKRHPAFRMAHLLMNSTGPCESVGTNLRKQVGADWALPSCPMGYHIHASWSGSRF